MATSVEEVIQDRLREIDAGMEALMAERERLTRALKELGATGGAGRARGRGSSRRTVGATVRRGRAKQPRKRAPRGSNQQAILDHVTAHPGATTPQIAAATGIDRAVVYSAVSRLSAGGRLVKTDGEEGQVTYQVASAA
jgi:predicted transcriptional regulator